MLKKLLSFIKVNKEEKINKEELAQSEKEEIKDERAATEEIIIQEYIPDKSNIP